MIRIFMLVLLLVKWDGNFGPVLTSASIYWSLENQMKVEERPFTNPTLVASGGNLELPRGTFNKILYPKLREMHRNCDGQCFYAPSECVTDPGLKNGYHCRLMASIAAHGSDDEGEMYCDYFGSDSLRESFCASSGTQQRYLGTTGRKDSYFTVTLHRTFLDPMGDRNVADYYEAGPGGKKEKKRYERPYCSQKWNDVIGRRCKHKEFVAISFLSKNLHQAPPAGQYLHEEDLWYVCTADETKDRVTMWTSISDAPRNGTQVKVVARKIQETKPHIGSGMGVVFSKVYMDENALSMGCQFVIQVSNMTLTHSHKSIPKNAAYFGDLLHHPFIIKLAMGWVERDDKSDAIRRPFIEPSSTSSNLFRYHMVFMGKEGPNGIAPTNEIAWDQLQVNLKDKSDDIDETTQMDKKSMEKIREVVRMCGTPKKYPKLDIACYPPRTQVNCIHNGRCAAMFIVTRPKSNRSFKKIKAYVYSNLPDHRSLRKVIRPKGFVSVGFSNDEKMGSDVVITCHADGMQNINVHVSLNYPNTNIYPGEVDYDDLVYNVVTYGTVTENRILCSWEMNSSFHVNMFSYKPLYRDVIPPGQSEKLEFDFRKNDYFLLLAAGNRNYPKGMIVYHDFRQSLNEMFGKKSFYQKVSGGSVHKEVALLVSLFAIAVLFF